MEQQEEKNDRKRRLLFLFIWLFLLTIILSTVTYAWFTSNRIVELHFFDIHVETDGGLEISENAIDWKNEVTVEELIGAYNTYPDSLNQIPGSMLPMSTGGILDGNGYLNMFYGQAENGEENDYYLSAYRKVEKRTTEEENEGDFIAFDIFIRTTNAKSLYLDNSSYVLPKDDAESLGIENSARVAFIKEGVTPSDTNLNQVQNMKTNDSNNVIIWEPNYDTHTAYGIQNAYEVYGINTSASNAPVLPYDGVIGTVSSSSRIKLNEANATMHPSLFRRVNVGFSTKKEYTQNNYLFELGVGVTKIRIYMWLEGQDVDSENRASEGDITYFLRFTLNP